MKLVIAQMKHETNTFSPVPTPIGRFARGGPNPLEGDDAAKMQKLLDVIEDLDDVQDVYHNAEL